MSATIAIIGRPNVGKSTLFNRLVGKRLALVDDMPGLTRDRKAAEADIAGTTVTLIDTAGLEEAPPGSIAARMRAQSETAIAGADLVLFVIDARAGLVPADEAFAAFLRDTGKPVLLVANKCEGRASDAGYLEAFKLGLGEPVAVSAEHGLGLQDLHAEVAQRLAIAASDDDADADDAATDDPKRPIKLAIVGRPNAGKSTLVNALLGEERMIVGPEPGLTRDSIATDIDLGGRPVRLWDTAGLRRKARIDTRIEKLIVGDALNAIRFAEIIVLLADATQALERQDLTLADLCEREGRALVIALSKWDLVSDKEARLRELREEVALKLPQVKGVPLVPLSALTGKGLARLMPMVFQTYDSWNRRLPTATLNRWFQDALARHTPPAVAGRRVKLRYITQANARPPTFVLFCSTPNQLPTSYLRYLVNDLRDAFDLWAVPIRMHMRKSANPFAEGQAPRPRRSTSGTGSRPRRARAP